MGVYIGVCDALEPPQPIPPLLLLNHSQGSLACAATTHGRQPAQQPHKQAVCFPRHISCLGSIRVKQSMCEVGFLPPDEQQATLAGMCVACWQLIVARLSMWWGSLDRGTMNTFTPPRAQLIARTLPLYSISLAPNPCSRSTSHRE